MATYTMATLPRVKGMEEEKLSTKTRTNISVAGAMVKWTVKGPTFGRMITGCTREHGK